MIIKLFKQNGITVVNVVRREEQVEMLKKEYDADYVLNSSNENFDAELYELSTKLGCNVGLECVAGDMPGRILQVLARNGVLISYGQLSEQPIGPINPIVLIFKAQKIEPFLLPYWIASKSLWAQWSALSASKKLIQTTKVNKCFGLHQIQEAIEYYKANMTEGKVFLKPSLTE
jgi:NADPH:quinone reductase